MCAKITQQNVLVDQVYTGELKYHAPHDDMI